MFVWVRAVCGIRIHHSGSGNAGPAPGKIHEKDPERDQGDSTYNKNEEFLDFGDVSGLKMSSG